MTTSSLHHDLSAALQPLNAEYARMAADAAQTEIEALPAPFLTETTIYQVTHFARHKSIVFYVGYAPSRGAALITGQPDAYARIAQAEGARLATEAEAAAYARLYVQVTRPLNVLFYLVDSVEDVKFRPTLEGAEAGQKKDVLHTYQALIQPPKAVRVGDGYRVTLYAVREQQLERLMVTLDAALTPHVDSEVLAAGLPLVYGGR